MDKAKLMEAYLRKMLQFSDARGVVGGRTAEESGLADRVSDLLAEIDDERKLPEPSFPDTYKDYDE